MIPLSIFSIDLSSGNLILLVSLLMFVAILMAKVGTKFGVTRERIRQIEAKALRKLKHPSRIKKLADYMDRI